MEKLFGRSKKFKSLVRKCHEFIDAQHGRGLAIIRVIPCIRTIVSIPAGLLRMPVKWFVGWSAAGIAVWNTALISFGYFFSEKITPLMDEGDPELKFCLMQAKFDVACTSSGTSRSGNGNDMGSAFASGICHSFTADGRCISLLKILFTNECIYDCKYCINRCTNDVERVTFYA